MKTQVLNQWIVYTGNQPAMWSLSRLRKDAIKAFLQDSNLTWNERKKYNWTIHAVIIDICFY